MKQREIIVEHKYIDNKYWHCFDDENYNLLELERNVYLNENERLNENNQAMQEEMARTWEKLQQKENIIKEVREMLIKYNDNESNYYAPIDIALKILDKGETNE